MAITFNPYTKTVLIEAPQTEITVQDLQRAIREWEASSEGIDNDIICNATGKDSLGGNRYTGITLTLINNWRVKFEDRPGPETVQCKITDGNLVAINDYGNTPIMPSTYTQVMIYQSTAPALIVYGEEGGGGGTGVWKKYSSGTIQADGNEQTLIDVSNEDGIAVCGWLNLEELQASDAVKIKAYAWINDEGGILYAVDDYVGVQSTPALRIHELVGTRIKITLQQYAGVYRGFDYEFYTMELELTPEQIADAVWDEAKAGHVVAGSFGEEVQSHSTTQELTDIGAVLSQAIDSVEEIVTYIKRVMGNRMTWDSVNKRFEIWNDEGTEVILRFQPQDKNGNLITMPDSVIAQRTKIE